MRDKSIWVFNAGNEFAGNPKWLFLYLQEKHPEISCYWLCYRRSLVEKMRALGYNAYLYGSAQARRIGSRAGVYVVEQNKERFHDYLEGIVVLNLWHGVTCKKLEHAVTGGYMVEGLVKKHIANEPVYRSQLMLVTSPEQEAIFKEQCMVADDRVIRAPYPRSFERCEASTFDHSIIAASKPAPTTRVALYAPTFRDYDRSAFFAKAIPDMERLIGCLEEHDWLLIVKTHPQMEGDFQLAALKARYGSHPRLLFWGDSCDIYEVFDQIDFAIVDYSSIFFDLLACGVKRFARYIFDYGDADAHLREFAVDYLDATCGAVCTTFDELLGELARTGDIETDPEQRARVFERAWSYARDASVEDIVSAALACPCGVRDELPVLYSFDVFDTVIARKSGSPKTVFRFVQDKMRISGEAFPSYLQERYVEARSAAEASCRQYMLRTLEQRGDGRTEITFDMIFDRLQETHGLNDRQVELLRAWELEGELAVVEGIPEAVACVCDLLDKGETVLFISDMYLPEAFVKELLRRTDPRLSDVPLLLSSTTGRQKSRKGLYLDAFHSLDYRFSKWVHTGDDRKADVKMARELGIDARLVPNRPKETMKKPLPVILRAKPEGSPQVGALEIPRSARNDGLGRINRHFPKKPAYATSIASKLSTFDACLVSELVVRIMRQCETTRDAFARAYVPLSFVPYIDWVVDHAVEQGFERLYFITRDGYHLRRIADAIIQARGLPLKTGYLYGSRKAWRLASQVGCIDDDFFSEHGNFHGVRDCRSLLEASELSDERFFALFPQLEFVKGRERISDEERARIVEVLRCSQEYRELLLELAASRRELVVDYLKQEIDFDERFAFVEYWGRGYTQACHTRLMREACPACDSTAYYYARSICPSEPGNVRFNLTDDTRPLIFTEAVFANAPMQTVSGYRREGGRVVPEYLPAECDEQLFQALAESLPEFARAYAGLGLLDRRRTARDLQDFATAYYDENQSDPVFLAGLAPLKDSVSMYGEPVEFAPRFKPSWLKGSGEPGVQTRSKRMSVARANPLARVLVSQYEKHIRKRG